MAPKTLAKFEHDSKLPDIFKYKYPVFKKISEQALIWLWKNSALCYGWSEKSMAMKLELGIAHITESCKLRKKISTGIFLA